MFRWLSTPRRNGVVAAASSIALPSVVVDHADPQDQTRDSLRLETTMTSGKPIAVIALEVDFQCQRKCEMRLNSQQLIVNPFFSQFLGH